MKDRDSRNGIYVSDDTIDITKIGPDTVIRLDKDRPKIRLGVLVAEETMMTVKTN